MKVAVLTGASSGIGAATARLLAMRGWRCVLLSRRPEPLERLAAEVAGEAEPCDVGRREQVDAVAARVAERHDAVHLLVSNAGIPGGGGFLDVAPERIEEVTRTNYLGGVWAVRAFLPLLEAGAPSDVVNVSSVAGVWATGGSSGPYTASKHAQLAFSRAVSVELAARRIRVHAVNPGPVRTEGFPQERLRGTRLDRFVLDPEQVADAILRSVERDRAETYVFGAYRVAALVQAAFPGTVARMAAARRRRRRG